LEILKAVNPEEYSRLDEAIRQIQGARKAVKAEEEHEYEVAIGHTCGARIAPGLLRGIVRGRSLPAKRNAPGLWEEALMPWSK
jgi:hypothetical protein